MWGCINDAVLSNIAQTICHLHKNGFKSFHLLHLVWFRSKVFRFLCSKLRISFSLISSDPIVWSYFCPIPENEENRFRLAVILPLTFSFLREILNSLIHSFNLALFTAAFSLIFSIEFFIQKFLFWISKLQDFHFFLFCDSSLVE